METITEDQMSQYLGATGEELLKLRILIEPDEEGHYPQAAACRTLLAIRQGLRARDPITEQYKQAQAQARCAGLLQRLKRGVARRVPK